MSFDHVIQAKRRLLAQYQDKPKFLAFAAAFLASCQPLEDAAQSILNFRALETAFGARLDAIGDIVVLQRNGDADNTYRHKLGGKIVANACTGAPEELRAILDFLMSGINPVYLREEPPAVTVLRTFELPVADGIAFAQITASGAPIGTRVIVEWEVPTYVGPTLPMAEWGSDPAGYASFAEFGADPASTSFWAEAYDGRQ